MSHRRVLRWVVLLFVPIGLGYGMHHAVPPAPRSVIEVQIATLTPDGALLIEVNLAEGSEHVLRGPVNVWDTRSGTIQASYLRGKEFAGGLTPNGRFFVGELNDGTFHFIDLTTGFEWSARLGKARLRVPIPYALDASSDGRVISILNRLPFDGENERETLTVVEHGDAKPALETTILVDGDCSPFAANGSFVIYGQNHDLVVWNLGTRKEEKRLPRARPIETTADGKLLIGLLLQPETDRIRSVAVWQFPSLKLHGAIDLDPRLHYPPDIVLAPDGRHLTLVQSNAVKSQVEVWRLDPFRVVKTLMYDDDPRSSAAFAPDGNSLVVSTSRQMTMLDTATGKERWRYRLPLTEIAGRDRVTIIYSKDGSVVVPRNTRIPEMVFLDTQTGAERGRFAGFKPSVCVALRNAAKNGRIAYAHDVKAPSPPQKSVRQFFARWFPVLGWQNGYQVVDVPSGRVVFETKAPESRNKAAELLDDDTFVIAHKQPSNFRYEFWDIPSPPRWNWVLGVPAGLFAGCLLVRSVARQRGRKTPGAISE